MKMKGKKLCLVIAIILSILPMKVQGVTLNNYTEYTESAEEQQGEKSLQRAIVREEGFNNTMETATQMTINDIGIGKMNIDSDIDYFRFEVPYDGELSVTISHKIDLNSERLNWDVSLLSHHPRQLMSFQVIENKDKTTVKRYVEKGTYFVKMELYTFSQFVTKEYQISFNLKAGNFEKEHNDGIQMANDIKFGTRYTARVYDQSDRDYFKITVPYEGEVLIDFSHIKIENQKEKWWRIKLLDKNEKEYLEFYSTGEDSSINKNIKLSPGDYYLLIDHYVGYSIFDKDYTIKVDYKDSMDWRDHWAKREIRYAMDNGWVMNVDNFRPDDAITRAEFIKIVNKSFGFKEKAISESFKDIKEGQWWYNEVLIALKAGYIDAKQENFRPNDPIKREEVASIITSIMKNKDKDLDKIKGFKDYNKISEWARSSVEGAVEAGYMGKNSTSFNPRNNITRAESVVTLYRVALNK